jgi:GNAT superfamily N-acetyltransferase
MPSIPPVDFPVTIDRLNPYRVDAWIDASVAARGPDEVRRLSALWDDMREGKRVILTAWFEDVFLGHVTVLWKSEFEPFRRKHIPEIVDVWVQPDQRRKGIASLLLAGIEQIAREKNAAAIGLGVNVTPEFGAAHILYASSGYVPDGSGLWAHGEPVNLNDKITLDDTVQMMWVKTL